MIDRAMLETKRAQLLETILLHQGGVQMIDHLLGLLDNDPTAGAMSIDELARHVGGNGSTAEIIENES
jgi:hypothetical protein